ncbi:MAG: hypothetical protein ACLFQ2_01850, partial [Wenzhouxiangella sp.]
DDDTGDDDTGDDDTGDDDTGDDDSTGDDDTGDDDASEDGSEEDSSAEDGDGKSSDGGLEGGTVPGGFAATDDPPDDDQGSKPSADGSGLDGLGQLAAGDTVPLQFAEAGNETTMEGSPISELTTNEEPLNLSDLVEGATIDTISEFLTLNFDGTNTIIDVLPTAEGGSSQQFVLSGVDPTGMGETDQEILSSMIEEGMLKIDT